MYQRGRSEAALEVPSQGRQFPLRPVGRRGRFDVPHRRLELQAALNGLRSAAPERAKGPNTVATTITDKKRLPATVSTEQIPGRVAAPEEPGVASLDKVRDILFGGQMRDLDRRFSRVEERLTSEAQALREDTRKRLATLEQFARTETESLAQRDKAEHDERTAALRALRQELQEASAVLDKRLAGIDEQVARTQRDLRQQILDVEQRLREEFREAIDGVLARLSRDTDDLRTAKADRVTLAALFTEVAMRLTHDAPLSSEPERARE